MNVVILAGGKGTRLRPYTTTLPKPLMPVGDDPIVSIIIGQLKSAGAKKITLAVNHMAELIISFVGSGSKYGLPIEFSVEEVPLGTVGPIKLIQDLPEHFLVMNGDVLTDLDYKQFFQEHLRSGAELTIATYRREVNIDFGVLDIDAKKRLTGFREKPTYHFDVSMGVYAFSRSVLDHVPRNCPFGFDQLVLTLLDKGEHIHSVPHQGYWLDLGRPDDYDRANTEIQTLAGIGK
jgi:NDP-sugar pyrophosphorylase family protein